MAHRKAFCATAREAQVPITLESTATTSIGAAPICSTQAPHYHTDRSYTNENCWYANEVVARPRGTDHCGWLYLEAWNGLLAVLSPRVEPP
jgi:hypothetical protein